jgi:hypothetical protein
MGVGGENMSTDIAEKKIEEVLMKGDLETLSPSERVTYHNQVCKSLGLNPITKPFEYIKLNGKLTLYARKDCTDQLRNIRKVNIKIKSCEFKNDLCIVIAEATLPDGRFDEATGAVAVLGKKGEDLANVIMKAETKAKRRVTLSVCGLGFMDESEVSSISKEEMEVPVDMLDQGNIKYLKELISEAGGTEDKFCEHLKINSLEELPIEKWNGVCRMLEKKAKSRKSADAVLINQEFNREESLAIDAKLAAEE